MKKTLITVSIIIAVCFIAAFGVFLFSRIGSMDNLPQGELMSSYDSPDGEYTVNTYLCSGNATVDFAVRCEAVNNKTGDKRNIYWNYHCESAQVNWTDNRTVIINGISLDAAKDSYDYRKYI